MMRKKILLILLVIATATYAQQEVAQDTTATTKNIADKEKMPVFQGYSGGMMLHAGYLFGKNPIIGKCIKICFGLQIITGICIVYQKDLLHLHR